MHEYRTHLCNALRASDEGKTVRLSGWVHSKRDHGGVLFIDLRDKYGLTQIVIPSSTHAQAEKIRVESSITVTGPVILRSENQKNPRLPTGDIEVRADEIVVQGAADVLPFQVAGNENPPEDLRLKYRYLDIRREKIRDNLILRSQIISFLRKQMEALGFTEFQTPILTASSPEGARDFLVPSRLQPGKFYALPQAPQQFKQMAMVGGLDRYFQIAPCFRDEAARADRSPGEFYQLDFEMSYATQEDIFAVLEDVLPKTFKKFAPEGWTVSDAPFERITYKDAMEQFGCDKPDLRNPLRLHDASKVFEGSSFSLFANIVAKGGVILAIDAPKAGEQPRTFFDKLNNWAREEGAGGLGYLVVEGSSGKGPIAKHLDESRIEELKKICGVKDNDAVFFVAGQLEDARKFAARARMKVAEAMGVIEQNTYRFCWVVDFPMFEINEETKQIDFCHNPFSMPQGGMKALQEKDPLDIVAWQYDIICNGIELSSGAIRNHRPDIMIKAFEIAGYKEETVRKEFGGMLEAFSFGAPPHGGSAPGVDRMVMLLAQEPNIREVILFPLNQAGEDLLLGAPANVDEARLKELGIKLDLKKDVKKGSDKKKS